MASVRIRLTGANARNRKIIKILLRDMRAILGPFIGIYDGHQITIKVGNKFFAPEDDDALGWHQNDEETHTICLRPDMAPGQLYTICMHELGHAIGMDHGPKWCGHVMSQSPRLGRRSKRLTRKRRIESIADFCRSVALFRLK